MPFFPAFRWPNVLLALAIGLFSGFVANNLGMPLPWMLGPMLGCGILALAGAPVEGPTFLRSIVIPVIGVMLGAGFHPGILDHAASWVVTLAVLPAFLGVATIVSYSFYRVVGGYSPVNAFFCAAPGGINEMMILGGQAGGDEARIALAHALRIFVTISAIAFVFSVFLHIRAARGADTWIGLGDLSLLDAVLLIACGLVGLFAGRKLGLPAPPLFGPMILSAVAHLTGIVTAAPPTLLVIGAQVTMGTIIGCRFAGVSLRQMGRDMALGVGATCVLLCVTALFAALLGPLSGTPLAQGVLAYSPGGLTEMSLLSLAMGQDVAYVSTMHVARIVMILFAMPIIFRLIGKRLIEGS